MRYEPDRHVCACVTTNASQHITIWVLDKAMKGRIAVRAVPRWPDGVLLSASSQTRHEVASMLQAYSELTTIRPCGPRRDAIRAATYDLLDSRGWQEFQNLPSDAWATLSEGDKRRLQDRLLKHN